MPFVVPERPYQTPEWYKTMIEAWKELREGEFRAIPAIPGTPYIIRSWQSGSVNVGQIARIVVPGYPHHVTQKGHRRQQTFFGEEDYRAYVDHLMSEWCSAYRVDTWAYLCPERLISLQRHDT